MWTLSFYRDMVVYTIEILAWSFPTTREKRARWDFWTWLTSPNNLPKLISASQSSFSMLAARTWMSQGTSICLIMQSKMIISISMHLKKHNSQQTIRATLLSCIRARNGWSLSKHTMRPRNMRSRKRDTQKELNTCLMPSLKIAVHSMTSSRRLWRLMIPSCLQSTTSISQMFIPLWISSQTRQRTLPKKNSSLKIRACRNMKSKC